MLRPPHIWSRNSFEGSLIGPAKLRSPYIPVTPKAFECSLTFLALLRQSFCRRTTKLLYNVFVSMYIRSKRHHLLKATTQLISFPLPTKTESVSKSHERFSRQPSPECCLTEWLCFCGIPIFISLCSRMPSGAPALARISRMEHNAQILEGARCWPCSPVLPK